jgi:UPF0716 protein FxsA
MSTSTPPPAGDPYARRPRSRVRSALALGAAGWAVLEIWLLVLVGEAAGGWVVALILVAGLVAGAAALKHAGRSALRGLTAATGVPGAGPEEGPRHGPGDAGKARRRGGAGLVALGGVLLMVPGLLSDLAGLLCLFPPTRSLLRLLGARLVERRLARSGPLADLLRQARASRSGGPGGPDGPGGGGTVIQGEVVDRPGEPGGRQGGDRGNGPDKRNPGRLP